MATPTATAGCYQSHGEDFVHYSDARGNVMCSVDGRGVMYATDMIMSNGMSLRDLQQEVAQIIISGLPSVIDTGTF